MATWNIRPCYAYFWNCNYSSVLLKLGVLTTTGSRLYIFHKVLPNLDVVTNFTELFLVDITVPLLTVCSEGIRNPPNKVTLWNGRRL
jgi:hypothetical protein